MSDTQPTPPNPPETPVDASAPMSAEELEAWADDWVRLWCADTTVKRPVAQPLAAAMAEFLLASKRAGASTRALRALDSDLHVGGLLYFYDGDRTTAARALASFAAGTASYTAAVANGTTSLTVTPTAADAGATLTVNGTKLTYAFPGNSLTVIRVKADK